MVKTVLTNLANLARQRPDAMAFAERVEGRWQATSWQQYQQLVERCGRALLHLGLAEHGTVGLLGFNRSEWSICCLGAMAARGIPVGIYQTCSSEQVAYIVDHAEARIVLVEDHDQWRKLLQAKRQLPNLQHIILMRGAQLPAEVTKLPKGPRTSAPSTIVPGTIAWDDFLALAGQVAPATLAERQEAIVGSDTATFIYTSGTTARPKAVMLSHSNLAETSRIGALLHDLSPDDTLVSYLPLAHIAEQMMSVHMPPSVGYAVYYAESPELLLDNLQEVQPTVFFAVPRVWERFYAGIQSKLSQATGLKARLVHWALAAGQAHSDALLAGQRPGLWNRLRFRLANRLVLSKMRHAIGLSQTHLAASGAAPISREMLEFFASLGIPILEVYGLSECCGPGTWNRHGRIRLGTVGPVIPDAEVKLADDGEVLLRGPNVFQGYFKAPAATEAALQDGWLHTGDLGSLDEQGFLTISGRKKEIIITSGGKNIAPVSLENRLKEIDLVGDAVVIGDGRHYLTALVTLEEEAAARFAAVHNITSQPNLPPHLAPQIRQQVQSGVDAVNQRVAKVETIRQFRILSAPFSVDEGELTPTLKLKRRVIAQRYAAEIEEMYE